MRLLDWLEEKGIPPYSMVWARMLGVKPNHAGNIVTGKRQPSIKLAFRIEEITEGRVSISDLYGKSDSTRRPRSRAEKS